MYSSAHYLSMSIVVEDSRKLLGAAVLSLFHDSRVQVPPIDGEPMKPHARVLQVSLSDTGVKTVNLTACLSQDFLQLFILSSHPAKSYERKRMEFISVRFIEMFCNLVNSTLDNHFWFPDIVMVIMGGKAFSFSLL